MTISDNPLADDLESVLDRTRDLWDEMRGGRLFITGGTGFFGCWLLETFLWANERLRLNADAVVLTRNLPAFEKKAPHLAGQKAVAFLQGDVKDFAFPDGGFSHVIHAATEATPELNESAPLAMLDGIVLGTRHTLDFAVHSGAGKFLLTSSGAVYGPQPSGMTHVPEEYLGAPSPVDRKAPYGEGKRVAELLCSLYSATHGIETKIARCFAFVGPYLPLDAHYAVGNFIRDAMDREAISVRGDGTPRRSYLYASDLAVSLWSVLFKGKSCYPYNVGSSHEVTIKDLAYEVASVVDPGVQVHVLKDPVAGVPAEWYVPAVERIYRDLNIKENVTLRDAIFRTADWNRRRNHSMEGLR